MARAAAAGVVRQILEEGKDEAVTGAHASRWGGERVAAGVKRARGGAIVVTVDATEIAALEKPASLESLLEEITTGSPEIAYTVFEHADGRIAFGDEPADAPASPGERSLAVKGRPVLEFASDVPLAGGETARLRLGMRLDNVRRVEAAHARPPRGDGGGGGRRWWRSPSASPGCAAATASSARSTRARRRRCAVATASRPWASSLPPWPTRSATR